MLPLELDLEKSIDKSAGLNKAARTRKKFKGSAGQCNSPFSVYIDSRTYPVVQVFQEDPIPSNRRGRA